MIELSPISKSDLSFLLEVRNDESTRSMLKNSQIFTLSECENWFESSNPEWFIIKVDGISVGYIRTNGDEIGCDIHPNFRRRGYAKMAYELYLKDKEYATLDVFEDNFASNLYKKLGFVETGKSQTIRGRNYIQMVYNATVDNQ